MHSLALPLRERVHRLASVMREIEQLKIDVRHDFAAGLYARSGVLPAGSVIVGVEHKRSHFVALLSGRMVLVDAAGIEGEVIEGPLFWKAQAGSQRAIHALTECWIVTFHATTAEDVAAAEDDLVVSPQDLQTRRLEALGTVQFEERTA